MKPQLEPDREPKTSDPMSIERKARILNGMIVLIACLLTVLDNRFLLAGSAHGSESDFFRASLIIVASLSS